MARAFQAEEDFVSAQAVFDTAVLLAPDEGAPYFWRGRFLGQAGQFSFGRSDLEKAIELSPSLSSAYLELGVLIARSGGDMEEARAMVEEALERAEDPRNPVVLEQAERVLEDMDQLIASGGR